MEEGMIRFPMGAGMIRLRMEEGMIRFLTGLGMIRLRMKEGMITTNICG